MNGVKQITRLINSYVFIKVCICLFELCYDGLIYFSDFIFEILSAFDLTSNDRHLLVFITYYDQIY
jgi:hypothetical protein